MKASYLLAAVCTFTLISTCVFAQDDYKSAMKKNNEKFKGSSIKCDVKFATRAAETNLIDIQFAQLAQTKGSSQQVKDLGKSMYDGHTKANAELKTIADKDGIFLPATLCKHAQKCYDKLNKKSGTDFDKAYVKGVAKGHKHEIKCGYLHEAEKGKDEGIRQWAADKLSTLYEHLHMAKEACKALKS